MTNKETREEQFQTMLEVSGGSLTREMFDKMLEEDNRIDEQESRNR